MSGKNPAGIYVKIKFTLVELMVVMIIMVILFGITVPALMSVQSAQGVETSARKLQAVLLNTRALAAKYNGVYSVVFSSVNPNDGTASNTAEDHWYAVVGHEIDGGYPGTTNDVKDQQIGPRYYLGNGAKWKALTFKYDTTSSLWNSSSYVLPASQGTQGFGGTDVRISFMPTGEARFKSVTNYSSENGLYQTIAIAKDGDEDNVYLRLVINKYSGSVAIMKK